MSKLYRSRRDKKVTGLCGGLAEAMNVDATLLRLLVVITTFFTGGTVIFIYFIAAIVIPKEPGYDQPPYDPYMNSYGRQPYQGAWQSQSHQPQHRPFPSQHAPHHGGGHNTFEAAKPANNIDEMMKDIEKKALQREVEELRAKVARFEKQSNEPKGDV